MPSPEAQRCTTSCRWRRNPAAIAGGRPSAAVHQAVPHESVVAALQKLDSFVDITEDDLIRLHRSLSAEPVSPPKPHARSYPRVRYQPTEVPSADEVEAPS